MDLYKFAAQEQLRFSSVKGDLAVEQLFQLPLTSKSGFDLDTVAKGINAKLREISEESFVSSNRNPQRTKLTAALEIVKDVIATREAEAKAATDKRAADDLRQRINDAIRAKKDQQLTSAPLEELEAQLRALDNR